jgi:hypothetical protein
MDNYKDQLKDINAIREMMEKSNKFISLSGLSGVIAGLAALVGAALAKFNRVNHLWDHPLFNPWVPSFIENFNTYSFYFFDAALVILVAVGAGIIPTMARAKKKKQPIFNPTAFRMFINFLIPILAGGLFCILLINYSLFGLIAPSMLIFYGLALINASHYTLNDIRYLGYIQIILGFVNGIFIHHALYFWAFGFGVMHIVYGLFMYFKYERHP